MLRDTEMTISYPDLKDCSMFTMLSICISSSNLRDNDIIRNLFIYNYNPSKGELSDYISNYPTVPFLVFGPVMVKSVPLFPKQALLKFAAL